MRQNLSNNSKRESRIPKMCNYDAFMLFHVELESVEYIELWAPYICTLNLSRNWLKDITPLGSLTNLLQLDLSENFM
jgi:Leucine-rich repeat (LRR) protein